jgi:hypothetical protein
MPEVVRKKVEFPGRGRPERIDWDAMADGRVYRLVSGVDFTSESGCVQSAAHQAAKRRGMLCRTVSEGANVVVQFYAPSDDEVKS